MITNIVRSYLMRMYNCSKSLFKVNPEIFDPALQNEIVRVVRRSI